jgi:hypothetical protein
MPKKLKNKLMTYTLLNKRDMRMHNSKFNSTI